MKHVVCPNCENSIILEEVEGFVSSVVRCPFCDCSFAGDVVIFTAEEEDE